MNVDPEDLTDSHLYCTNISAFISSKMQIRYKIFYFICLFFGDSDIYSTIYLFKIIISLMVRIFFFQLDTRKSLVDQCVQGEGMVQINLEIKSQPGMDDHSR